MMANIEVLKRNRKIGSKMKKYYDRTSQCLARVISG